MVNHTKYIIHILWRYDMSGSEMPETGNVVSVVNSVGQHEHSEEAQEVGHVSGLNESELNDLESGSSALLEGGLISQKQAEETKQSIEAVRKSFRNLTDQQKRKVINQRAQMGMRMMDSTLTGSTAVVEKIILDHGILKNLFLQFVPYYDRAIVNMNMFGEDYFGQKNNKDRLDALSKLATDFYESAVKARLDAENLCDKYRSQFDENGAIYYNPTVPTPALQEEVHIHNRISMKYLRGFIEFNRLISLCSWLEWNECRTSKEISNITRPLFNQAINTGRRGYLTFADLMKLKADAIKNGENKQAA